jgi:hypothetical protein
MGEPLGQRGFLGWIKGPWSARQYTPIPVTLLVFRGEKIRWIANCDSDN